MKKGHDQHGAMSQQMIRRHYTMFGLNMLVSTIIMYLVMFEMIRGWGEFVQNINFFYMALTMAMPMGALMLLMMRSMYADKRLNLILYIVLTVIFVGAFAAVRTQALVGDKQFVRSMIPHHSGAILMCNQSSLRDAEVRDLCFKENGIVKSQEREIAQMKAILWRL
ncbi:MAG: DUF305 domain-containing protein [Sphingomicrobium sp.]